MILIEEFIYDFTRNDVTDDFTVTYVIGDYLRFL